MKEKSLILLALTALVILAIGCSAPPTPTRVPTPTITLTPLPPTATKPPPPPTVPPTLTPIPASPTPAFPSATPTRTRVAVVATPKPAATPTVPRPANPKGSIAYHVNDGGVDRMSVIDVERGLAGDAGAVRPFVSVGPVMDLKLDDHGTNAHIGEWSPVGPNFVYISTIAPNSSNILKVWDPNRDPVNLYSSDTGGGLSSPTWSSDGKRIAFIKMSGNKDNPAWSLIIIPSDGTKCGEQFECLNKVSLSEQYRGGVSWGKENLLTISYNTTESPDVYTVYANGEGARNLTKNPGDDIAPVFSPDGKSIAFTSNREGGQWRIYVMNADGTNVRRVTSGPMDLTPTWSPDGNWIGFASTRGGQFDIWMVDIHGANLTQITKTGGDHPSWTR